jgi:hypothetical protein
LAEIDVAVADEPVSDTDRDALDVAVVGASVSDTGGAPTAAV